MLDDYIKGRLDEVAKSTLEMRLAADQDLREDLADLKVLQQGMRAKVLSEKLETIKGWEKELVNKEKTNGKWKKWFGLIFFIGVLGYLLYYMALKSEKVVPVEYKSLYADRFDKELILHKTMRATVQTDSLTVEQRRAYELYSIQLFDDAIPLLKTLWETKRDTLALFYLGVSYIGVGEKDKGLEILKQSELSKFSKQTNIFINH